MISVTLFKMTCRNAKVNEEKPMGLQPYTKNCRQLRKAESGRDGLPEGRACQLVVLCQLVSPDNTHTSHIMWGEQVIIKKTYVYIHMRAITISKKEDMDLEESEEEYMKGFGRRKGQEAM